MGAHSIRFIGATYSLPMMYAFRSHLIESFLFLQTGHRSIPTQARLALNGSKWCGWRSMDCRGQMHLMWN
jgi:hypothetical protein